MEYKIDSDEMRNHKALTEKLLIFMKGNTQAVRFLLDLFYVVHLWDDLYDGDKNRSKDDINEAFRIALVDIPKNPFYFDNLGALQTVIMNAILQWMDANKLEQGPCLPDHDLHIAYMLRAGLYQVISYCAYIIGGAKWAEHIGPEIRLLYEEKLETYMEEMKNA